MLVDFRITAYPLGIPVVLSTAAIALTRSVARRTMPLLIDIWKQWEKEKGKNNVKTIEGWLEL